MKGIILAGGNGTRLSPITNVTSKQLLPIYDKPMIYYPLSTLMLAKIKDILIISTKEDIKRFEKLLGDGSQFGISLSYAVQEKPNGLAEAFIIGEDFIDGDCCAMILGDNIFYGGGFSDTLEEVSNSSKGATIFGYCVEDPQRFGIVEFDENENVISVEEKPKNPKSNYCITGLYFYDENVVKYAKQIKPSKRNELEITDLNNIYLKSNQLKVKILSRGFAWFDTGTIDSLLDASQFVSLIEKRQSVKIAVPEEIAYINNWIDKNKLLQLANNYKNSPYGEYLKKIAK